MSDTYGPTSATPSSPFAQWSPSLRTWTDTGLWGLTLSLGTLPTWGCLHGGELYELPTPERPTVASESSSRLPTPHAGLGERGRDGVYPNPKGQQDLQHTLASLLPTPTAQAAKHGSTPDTTADGFGYNLWDLPHLLPGGSISKRSNAGSPSSEEELPLPLWKTPEGDHG